MKRVVIIAWLLLWQPIAALAEEPKEQHENLMRTVTEVSPNRIYLLGSRYSEIKRELGTPGTLTYLYGDKSVETFANESITNAGYTEIKEGANWSAYKRYEGTLDQYHPQITPAESSDYFMGAIAVAQALLSFKSGGLSRLGSSAPNIYNNANINRHVKVLVTKQDIETLLPPNPLKLVVIRGAAVRKGGPVEVVAAAYSDDVTGHEMEMSAMREVLHRLNITNPDPEESRKPVVVGKSEEERAG